MKVTLSPLSRNPRPISEILPCHAKVDIPKRKIKIPSKSPSIAHCRPFILPKGSRWVEKDAGLAKLEHLAIPEALKQGQARQAAATGNLAIRSLKGKEGCSAKGGDRVKKATVLGPPNSRPESHTSAAMTCAIMINAADVEEIEILTVSGNLAIYGTGSRKNNIDTGGPGTSQDPRGSSVLGEREVEVVWNAIGSSSPDVKNPKESEVATKQPLKHQVGLAKKAEFFARYSIPDPSWIYCCCVSQSSVLKKDCVFFTRKFIFHLDLLQLQGICTV